ncbi:MAG: sigma-70 family RNA polymerase sigma factor [Erythrobacter sp.]|uniref:sigma-70 family RNA polymerase sigma factor n=1 Tax=Erythrobacter sp. TaxID=1042 RepID=UPI00260A9F2E|nr:sigma-70 family RNA polymerase sigma factor [Erythrobacter sp.]MDJ0977659.1 sigma-70 family RNA polymerase sigma factor [Erythrobacter sp.]
MANPLDSHIYCSPYLSVTSLDQLLDVPGEDGRPFQIPDYAPTPDIQVAKDAAGEEVNTAVENLPPRQREVIRSIFFSDHTVTQTAKALEISASAVVKLRKKALKRLATILIPQRDALLA